MKNKLQAMGVLTLMIALTSTSTCLGSNIVEEKEYELALNDSDSDTYIPEEATEAKNTYVKKVFASEPETEKSTNKIKKNTRKKKESEIGMSVEDMRLIAWITMAEAEGESEYGRRLVIDTVLNRVDSKYFPDSVREVIYQPYQFSSIKDGRASRCYVMDDIYELVKEEVKKRTDKNVIFFRTERYSDYGTPLYKVGRHYFSRF